MFTLAELEILIEGVATLICEYGERPERVALEKKLREYRRALREEVERAR